MVRSVGIAEVCVALALAACQAGPGIGPANESFERCGDPAGREAFDRAAALLERDRVAEAVPLLVQTVEACPQFVPGHLAYQDRAREVGGEVEAAMRAYYEALEDTPPSPVVPYLRARLLEEAAEALPWLQVALDRDETFYFAHLEKARIMRSINRTTDALQSLQCAVAARPDCPHGNLHLAEVLVSLGRAREAAPHYKKYVELRPDDGDARRAYLNLLVYSVGDLDEARKIAEGLSVEDDADVAVIMDQAAIAWKRGDFAGAQTLYHRVLEIDPTRDRAVLNLANLYYDGFGSETDQRPEYWPKARAAYRYFIEMRRAEGLFDVLDYHIGVPYRLEQITALLGEAPPRAPTLQDF